jgi:hypothetical protein
VRYWQARRIQSTRDIKARADVDAGARAIQAADPAPQKGYIGLFISRLLPQREDQQTAAQTRESLFAFGRSA